MRLITIALFFVLLYNFFGTIATASDHNTITDSNVEPSVNDDNFNLATSCIFGVKSVSIVLYMSNIPNGKIVQVNESCNLIDPSKPVFFMTHGFLSNSLNYNFPNFASLLCKKDYAVFSLDWSNAACYNNVTTTKNLLEYPLAVRNTREVGIYLASYVKSLIDSCDVPLKNITFMGHSLGAHVSSFAAKDLQKSGYDKILLLIATDPAYPLFMFSNCEGRLCKKDAERVIILHTSAAGIQRSIGHLDLWFNNGLSQPACGDQIIGTLQINCSHNIAIMYLTSMWSDDCVYIGVPIHVMPGCSSDRTNCIIVDNKIFYNTTTVGDYCVSVASKYPFCIKNDFECQKQVTSILNTIILL